MYFRPTVKTYCFHSGWKPKIIRKRIKKERGGEGLNLLMGEMRVRSVTGTTADL